jgi:hypothetical protein
MKKTSRRRFAKQLAGALAALPLASVVIDAQRRKSQSKKSNKGTRTVLKTEFRSEHNTPPPGLFMGGSLVFETFSDKDDWDVDGDIDPTINRRKWSVKPRPYDNGMTPTNICIAHLKFIDGAGEMVFPTYNNESNRETPIVITATLRKNSQSFGECILTTTGDHFEISLPNNKRLKNKPGDLPANSRRQRVRYMHPNIGNTDACEWIGLRIVKGNEVIYDEPNLPGLPAYDETMRLMIWWENR